MSHVPEHYFYIIRGSREYSLKLLPTIFKSAKIKEFFIETCSVAEARNISSVLSLKNDIDTVYLFHIDRFTNDEPQNTLLKIAEETQTQFVISLPKSVSILDTVLSRAIVYSQPQNSEDDALSEIIELFLKSDHKKRQVQYELAEKQSEAQNKKVFLRVFLEQCIVYLKKNKHDMLTDTMYKEAVRVLLHAFQLLENQKSSSKAIIEYVSLYLKRF